jgi:hypothetical protein
MNGAQQRTHTRTTDALADVIDQTQRAVVERFEEVEASFAAMHEKVTRLVDAERTARLQLRRDFYESWHQTTFWQRLRWLVTGA